MCCVLCVVCCVSCVVCCVSDQAGREQRCVTFRSANVVKPLIPMQKVVRAGNTVVLDEKYPHIRNIRDGTVIKLDVSNGV